MVFAHKIKSGSKSVQTCSAVTLAMIAGFGLGTLGVEPINAQTIPPAYVFTLFDTGLKSLIEHRSAVA